MNNPTVVFVPGLRDHMPDHWQTLLQARLPDSLSVPRLGKENLRLADWVDALDETIALVEGLPVVVAHSAGVIMVAHWALTRTPRPILGALLAVPPDFEAGLPAGYPPREALAENGWMPVPRAHLPFPSIVVASTNDPLATMERAAGFAHNWGAELVNAGAVGHLNPASGFGEWPQAIDLLLRFGVEVAARPASVRVAL